MTDSVGGEGDQPTAYVGGGGEGMESGMSRRCAPHRKGRERRGSLDTSFFSSFLQLFHEGSVVALVISVLCVCVHMIHCGSVVVGRRYMREREREAGMCRLEKRWIDPASCLNEKNR